MATSNMDGFTNELARQLDVVVKRRYHLEGMEDEFAKEWIIELQEKVESLQDENGRILRAAGNSAFNPLIF